MDNIKLPWEDARAAYNAGYDAGDAGIERDANPYNDPKLHASWAEGWADAQVDPEWDVEFSNR